MTTIPATRGGTPTTASSPQDDTAARLLSLFESPPREFSPVPIWWWSGDEVRSDRVRWQLERFAEGGVFNLIVLNLAPSGPLYGKDQDRPAFLSPGWWQVFEQACVDAAELGIRLWFYDQIGFSGANLQGAVAMRHPELLARRLTVLDVEGEGELRAVCPEAAEPVAAYDVALDADGGAAGAPRAVVIDGVTATCDRPDRHRLRLVHAVPHGYDYSHPRAGELIMERLHHRMEEHVGPFLGTVIAGSFQDELPTLPTWSAGIAEAFREATGHDLRDRIWMLWEGDDDESRRTRIAYHDARARLCEAGFFRPMFEWHERHGMICGFDQQGPARSGDPLAGVQTYADYFTTQRWYGAPGSDHHGDAKLHSSIAHLYGRPRVWIESFWGTGWGGTLEETYDWLVPWIRAGATLYNPHAAYYSTHGGWWEWGPPSTCWRQPYWRHYRRFADGVARLCALLSEGSHVCDVAVLYPTATVQAGSRLGSASAAAERARDCFIDLAGVMFWHGPRTGVLDGDGRDFDVVDDESLQRGEVAGGALTIGDERYAAVVLPACEVIPAASAARLVELVETGGVLVAVAPLPSLTVGGDDRDLLRLRELAEAGRVTVVASAADVPAALASLPRQVEAPVPTLRRRVGEHEVLFVPALHPGATVQHQPGTYALDYDFDPSRYPSRMHVRVRGVSGAPELWDPFTGERTQVSACDEGEGIVSLDIPMDGRAAALLVWTGEDAAQAAGGVGEEIVPLDGPWRSAFQPTLENRFGDVAKPDAEGAPPVQTWSFEHAVERDGGDGVAAGWFEAGGSAAFADTVNATFGTRAWSTGSRPPGEMPVPLPAGAGALDVDGWTPAEYSLTRGIDHDRAHLYTLGPSGHVPHEFLDLGPIRSGEAVHVRTAFVATRADDVHLVVGSSLAKRVWLNGTEAGSEATGYQMVAPAPVRDGLNILEIRLQAGELSHPPGSLEPRARAFWALTSNPVRMRTPEYVRHPGDPVPTSPLRFSIDVDLESDGASGEVIVGSTVPCRVLLDGTEVGRQGGFDPYVVDGRIIRHSLGAVARGRHTLSIEMVDGATAPSVMVDGRIEDASRTGIDVISGRAFRVQRGDAAPLPVELVAEQKMSDPATQHLRRRPHPLPAAAWLDGVSGDGAVIEVDVDAFMGGRRVEWLRWTVPPGAMRMHVPCRDSVRLWVDGEEQAVDGGVVRLAPGAPARAAVARVECGSRSGGALLDGPVTYEVGDGVIAAGDWSLQGLAAYSGGVRYERTLSLAAGVGETSAVLDLGRVRGTAEVWVNGEPAGVRVMSPYRFDCSGLLHAGENTVSVLVLNTMGPWVAATSPAHLPPAHQLTSGIFGPVRLRVGGAPVGSGQGPAPG